MFKDGPTVGAGVRHQGQQRLRGAGCRALAKAKPAKPEELGLDARAADGIRELGSMCELEAPETAVLEAAAFFRFVPETAPGS